MKTRYLALLTGLCLLVSCGDENRLPHLKGNWQSACTPSHSPLLDDNASIRWQIVFPEYDMSKAQLSKTVFEDAFCTAPLFTMEIPLALSFPTEKVIHGDLEGRKRVDIKCADPAKSYVMFHAEAPIESLVDRETSLKDSLEPHKKILLGTLQSLNRGTERPNLLIEQTLQSHIWGEGEDILELGLGQYPFFGTEISYDQYSALVKPVRFTRVRP